MTWCPSKKSMEVQSFKLCDPVKHIYEEGNHVLEFKLTSEYWPEVNKDMEEERPSAVAIKMGQLVDKTHKSCSSTYECSCEKID